MGRQNWECYQQGMAWPMKQCMACMQAREDLFFENFECHQAQNEEDAGNVDGGEGGMGPGMNGAGAMVNPMALMGMQQVRLSYVFVCFHVFLNSHRALQGRYCASAILLCSAVKILYAWASGTCSSVCRW